MAEQQRAVHAGRPTRQSFDVLLKFYIHHIADIKPDITEIVEFTLVQRWR